MKDNLKILFKDACPEPRDSAEFTERVLGHIRTGKPAETHSGLGHRLVGLFCSPIPVILILSAVAVIYHDSIFSLIGRTFFIEELSLEIRLSSATILIAACCMAVIAVVVSCLKDLSDSGTSVNWEELKLKISESLPQDIS